MHDNCLKLLKQLLVNERLHYYGRYRNSWTMRGTPASSWVPPTLGMRGEYLVEKRGSGTGQSKDEKRIPVLRAQPLATGEELAGADRCARPLKMRLNGIG